MTHTYDPRALSAAYWQSRAYWRDRVRELLPGHTSARDVVTAARVLHALTYTAQVLDSADHWRDSDAATLLEIIGARVTRDPRDVAAVAAVLALENVAASVTRRTAPAPDWMDGGQHTIIRRRSNSGRTLAEVKRSGVAAVQGSADYSHRVTVTRGQWTGAPARFAPLARALTRRGHLQHPRRVDVLVPTSAVRPDMLHQLGLELLAHAPRRGTVRQWNAARLTDQDAPLARGANRGGASGIAVERLTADLYGMPDVSDVRQWAEVTPPLPALDPRGIAVHRADMAGQTGVLALTDRLDVLTSTARQRDRYRLPAVRLRKSESHWRGCIVLTRDDAARAADTRTQTVHRDDRGRVTYLSRANHQHNARRGWQWERTYRQAWQSVPRQWAPLHQPRTRTYTRPSGHVFVTPADYSSPTVCHPRGPLANPTRGKRRQRTETQDPRTAPTTREAWVALAARVERGRRIAGVTSAGVRWSVNRSDAGTYSGTIRAADGAVLRFRRRTPDAVGRILDSALSA